jgi:spore germination protein GerM
MPRVTRVLSVKVANGIATVDLDERFASGSDRDSLLARLSQVVRTLLVRRDESGSALVNGGIVAARFPGISMSHPITFRGLSARSQSRRRFV